MYLFVAVLLEELSCAKREGENEGINNAVVGKFPCFHFFIFSFSFSESSLGKYMRVGSCFIGELASFALFINQ